MLTAEELADRKRARKLLEQKRVALEEAVERRVCEGVYNRIWRHRSTQDEAQDEKLRSKTAALAVVGIGLTDLGIDLGEEAGEKPVTTAERESEVREWLNNAREELLLMNVERYPLGKLQHLKAAHKGIVDTLSHFHPSSSADEIMPMLIYTLITSPAEGINVISNLYFIQRFRSESKIDGEAAYCLTNLEAAITFLETVDLASLRADEVLSGPPKSISRPSTPRDEPASWQDPLSSPPAATPHLASPGLSAPTLSPATVTSQSADPKITPVRSVSSSLLRPTNHFQQRRLSDIFQTQAQAIGAAGDAVLDSADQGFKTIGNSLGDSYKFLVGKLKERQENLSANGHALVPRTLDDARKLVGTPPLEDDGSASDASSVHSLEAPGFANGSKPNDQVLNLISGRKPLRERSVDSTRSAGSGKRVVFAEASKETQPKDKSASPLNNSAPTMINPLESMRNLGNTLNPIGRIAGMGMMRSFSRSTPAPVPPAEQSKPQDDKDPKAEIADLATVSPPTLPSTSEIF